MQRKKQTITDLSVEIGLIGRIESFLSAWIRVPRNARRLAAAVRLA